MRARWPPCPIFVPVSTIPLQLSPCMFLAISFLPLSILVISFTCNSRLSSMSTWLKDLLPWVHNYTIVRSSDEESNGVQPTARPGPPKSISRLFTRHARIVLTVLFVGVFTYLGSKLYANGHFRASRQNGSLSKSPLFDVGSLGTYPNTRIQADWSKFAYTQYVTEKNYLCNSLMIFEALQRLKSRAERLMMYPEQWSLESDSPESTLLRKARDDYNVKLVPIHVQHFSGEATWGDSFTKLLAFNQTQYERVISLDSDANVLQVMYSPLSSCSLLRLTCFIAYGRVVFLTQDSRCNASSVLARRYPFISASGDRALEARI